MRALLTIPWFRPEPIPLLPPMSWLPDGLSVHPFGMLVAMATLVGILVTDRRARHEGLHPRVVGELGGYILVGGFVIGHVLDALFYHWDVVVVRPTLVLELWNGLSSFGGFVGAVVGGLVWFRLRGRSLLAFSDPIAYSFPFGWTFGRLGCFVAHDHPGSVSDFALAVDDYFVRGMVGPRQPRHDLGLYEAMWSVAVALLFLWLGRTKRPRGFYLALLPIVYAPIRFGLDFLRATDVELADPRFFGLTPGHYGAIGLFIAGLAVAYRVWRGPEPTIAPDASYGGTPSTEADAIAAALAAASEPEPEPETESGTEPETEFTRRGEEKKG